VFDRDGDSIPERQARFPDGAGRVTAAHVDLRAAFADAHREEHVAARSIKSDDDAARRALSPLLDERELFEIQHVGADTIAAWPFVLSSSMSATRSCSIGSRNPRF